MTIKVSGSPHITSPLTTRKIMARVCIALIPCVVAAVYLFGIYSLLIIAVSVGFAVLTEYLFNKVTHRPQTVQDLSAVVSGLIFGLSLPVSVPLYLVAVGAVFAILVVKMLFGGIGKNFANPAVTARIFVTLAWASAMGRFVSPLNYQNGFLNEFFKYCGYALTNTGVDAVTVATPLADNTVALLNLFLGNHGGCIGEVCALAIIAGGIYLIATRTIDFKIPLVMLATFALAILVFCGVDKVLPSLLTGAVLFGAFFMATDYSSSPNSFVSIIIYSAGIGLLTAIIRVYGSYPEGVSFSILLMNITAPLLDKFFVPRAFGKVKKSKEAVK